MLYTPRTPQREDQPMDVEDFNEYDDGSDADPGDMDGDLGSALASAGWGTDEDYGGYADAMWD